MSKLYGFIRHQIGQYGDGMGNRIAKAIETEQKQDIKEIYITERKEYADRAREQFKALCHQGKIKKEQLKSLRSLLEILLGSYAGEYKARHYDNEFHRIYTYLKAYHLDKDDWSIVLKSLDEIHHSS